MIRRAVIEDAGALAELTTQLGYPASADELHPRLERILGRDDAALLVAVDEADAPIGWIHVTVEHLLQASGTALIHGLVVGEGHRSVGIGEALLAQAEAWARGCGCSSLVVRSRVTRERAHRFYERLGYARVKTSHVFEKPLV